MIKKTAFLLTFLFTFNFFISGQYVTKIKIAPGFGIGYFYPKDVNDHLYSLYSGYITTNLDIYMSLFASLGIIFQIGNETALKIAGEFAIAPKVVTGSLNKTFVYNRISPLFCLNKYFKVADNSSLFIGAGGSFSHLKFEQYTGTAPGIHLELGYRLDFDDYEVEAYVAGDYIKAKSNVTDFNLNYSGIRAGANFILNL